MSLAAELGRYKYLKFDQEWKESLTEKVEDLRSINLEGQPEALQKKVAQAIRVLKGLCEAPEKWKHRDEVSGKRNLDVILSVYRDLQNRLRRTAAAKRFRTPEAHAKLGDMRDLLLGCIMQLGSRHIAHHLRKYFAEVDALGTVQSESAALAIACSADSYLNARHKGASCRLSNLPRRVENAFMSLNHAKKSTSIKGVLKEVKETIAFLAEFDEASSPPESRSGIRVVSCNSLG